MSIFYVGSFPPPYGGVTVKNRDLLTALSSRINIDSVDLSRIKRGDLKEAVRLLRAFIGRSNTLVVGVAGKKTRRRFCKLLYYINRGAMGRSVIFLMGGASARDVAADSTYQKFISGFKRVYVETHGMERELEAVGLRNVGYYPNCRFRPRPASKTQRNAGAGLRCVFFSLIQPEKGADLVIEAARRVPEATFDFYGRIDQCYEDLFFQTIKDVPNIDYRGVFSGTNEEVYGELGKYDVLLFPTKWDVEGVPGILVEAKMAGITCIVSDKSYNAEIVADGKEGIVLRENTAEALAEALKTLDADRELLNRMKESNKKSARDYCLENYMAEIEDMCYGGVETERVAPLRCLFFSLVSEKKGIDLVLDAAERLQHVRFDIWGAIPAGEESVQYRASLLNNTSYRGVFVSEDDDVYTLLSGYDLLLLPTRWKAEGVPGVLVEAKIAGLPAVVSDINYNAEIVEDGVSGMVLKENTSEALADAISVLEGDRALLYQLKCGAKESAEAYYIENYIDAILRQLK